MEYRLAAVLWKPCGRHVQMYCHPNWQGCIYTDHLFSSEQIKTYVSYLECRTLLLSPVCGWLDQSQQPPFGYMLLYSCSAACHLLFFSAIHQLHGLQRRTRDYRLLNKSNRPGVWMYVSVAAGCKMIWAMRDFTATFKSLACIFKVTLWHLLGVPRFPLNCHLCCWDSPTIMFVWG